ncbi:MAG: hypothetical protein H0X25_16040 [Acidobacteriales bacterium]|nr:hypothetical protein [Terriglobales bacterium]
MKHILQRVKPISGHFVPTSINEYIGLQIARKLDRIDDLAAGVDLVQRDFKGALRRFAQNQKRRESVSGSKDRS